MTALLRFQQLGVLLAFMLSRASVFSGDGSWRLRASFRVHAFSEGQLWRFVLRAAKLKIRNRSQTKTLMLGTLRSQNDIIYSSVASLSSSLPGVGSAFSRSAVDISAAACVRSCSVLGRTVRVPVTSRLNYASPAARQSHVIEREKPLLVV